MFLKQEKKGEVFQAPFGESRALELYLTDYKPITHLLFSPWNEPSSVNLMLCRVSHYELCETSKTKPS